MAATTLASPPSSQIMDSSSTFNSFPDSSHLSPPRPSSDHGSDSSSSDQPDRNGRSLSLSRNSDNQSLCSLRSEEYRQLFRLPSEEVLLQDFNCAIQENILVQGHMYLFDHYICFYSNIFGFETKKIIPFQDITAVRRAKTAGIFPNAIEIVASGKKHFFASFLSRDEAFKLINDGWSQHSDGVKGSLDEQDSRYETNSYSNGVTPVENDNNFDSAVNVLNSDERIMEVSTSEDTKLPPNVADDNVQATASEVPDLVEESGNASVDAEPFSSGFVKWNQENHVAPKIPQCFTKVAESKFPINVEQFFNLFFSDDAFGFIESFHSKSGDKDFRCTSWSPNDKFGHVREKIFQHPIKIYFGAKCGGCKETQKFRVYKDRNLVIKTSQEVTDVPYADYFTVEGLWNVREDAEKSDECCVLGVYVNVAFSKRTMWKGKIEQSTMEECREAYTIWMHLAHELLKKKKIEKIGGSNINTIFEDIVAPGDQIDNESKVDSEEHSERLQANTEAESISDTVTNSLVDRQQSGNLFSGSLLDSPMSASTLRAAIVKFCAYLKRYGNLQMFLVIGFSLILLLMQLSIVVLLSRPQQIHVVPQASHLSSMDPSGGQRATGALHWLEKRMHLLKDEMDVVESQLERMRNEYLLLKSQYNDLEHLYQLQT